MCEPNGAERSTRLQLWPTEVNPTVVLTAMGRENWSDPVKAGPMLNKIPLGRFAEVPDSYENLRRAIFGPLGEALALIANDKVGVLRVVSAEPPFVGAAALVAHDVEESFVWPMDEALIALPSSLADVLVSSYAAVVVDEDDAAVGVVTLVMKDTGADDPYDFSAGAPTASDGGSRQRRVDANGNIPKRSDSTFHDTGTQAQEQARKDAALYKWFKGLGWV